MKSKSRPFRQTPPDQSDGFEVGVANPSPACKPLFGDPPQIVFPLYPALSVPPSVLSPILGGQRMEMARARIIPALGPEIPTGAAPGVAHGGGVRPRKRLRDRKAPVAQLEGRTEFDSNIRADLAGGQGSNLS